MLLAGCPRFTVVLPAVIFAQVCGGLLVLAAKLIAIRFVQQLLAARQGDLASPVALAIKGQRPYRGEGRGVGFVPLTSEALRSRSRS